MPHKYAFSVQSILRHFSWPLVASYFHSRGLFLELPCLSREEAEQGDIEALLDALEDLPTAQRTDVEQELGDVYELADEDGRCLLVEELIQAGDHEGAAVAGGLDGAHDAAIWALVNREDFFERLVRFHQSGGPKRYWHRRRGVPEVVPDTNDIAVARLSKALSDYLVREEGRGRHCHVDWARRAGGYLFIAYPEDFASSHLEYDEDERLVRRKVRPAQDLLFYYAPDQHMIEVFAKGGRQRVQDLQIIFALTILGITLTPYSEEEVAYLLERLKDERFFFLIDPATGLESIEVRWVHLRDRLGGGKSVTLEVDGPPGRSVVRAAASYWSIEDADSTDRYPFSMMSIDRARFQAFFRPTGRQKRGRTKTFTLNQYGSPLDHDGLEGVIRGVLLASGIEKPSPELVGSDRA